MQFAAKAHVNLKNLVYIVYGMAITDMNSNGQFIYWLLVLKLGIELGIGIALETMYLPQIKDLWLKTEKFVEIIPFLLNKKKTTIKPLIFSISVCNVPLGDWSIVYESWIERMEQVQFLQHSLHFTMEIFLAQKRFESLKHSESQIAFHNENIFWGQKICAKIS